MVQTDIRLRDIENMEDMPVPVEYIFLEIPNCSKAMTKEASLLDNFCYALKNMPEMEERPKELKGEIFDLLFNSAEINKFAPRERSESIKQMITIRDKVNQLATAEAKGQAKGKAENSRDIAIRMLEDGIDAAFISKYTQIPMAEILVLQEPK